MREAVLYVNVEFVPLSVQQCTHRLGIHMNTERSLDFRAEWCVAAVVLIRSTLYEESNACPQGESASHNLTECGGKCQNAGKCRCRLRQQDAKPQAVVTVCDSQL